MIEDLRFITRYISLPEGAGKIVKILQAYDGHVWFDVPFVNVRGEDEKDS